jgi:photosystem II stability/assembly factor-like uncharacterized protein
MRKVCLLILLLASSVATLRPGLAAQTSATVQAPLLDALRFRSIGPANMSGRVVDLAVVEADPYIFYAATATGGIWKTTDNGVTFTPLFDHEAVHSIGCITIFQHNPDVVWVGTGERANRQSSSWGDGVYKSTDGGKTWQNVGLRDSHHIGRIVTHPTDPNVVYVAAAGHLWGPNKERGLYKTADGGRTWTASLTIDEDTGVIDVAMDPSDPNTLYAAAYQRRRMAFGFHGGGPGSALYKTTDAGATWTKLTKDLPSGDVGRIGISIYRKDPRIVYVSVEQGVRYNASTAYQQRKAGIYRSEDKGATWRLMSDWNPRPMYASQITVDPNDDRRIYMVNSYSVSDDGGRTFRTPRQSLHGDDRLVWVDPKDSRHVIKADDGGLGISYDRGSKWLYVTTLPVSQFYHVAVDMQDPYWVYGGLQDNGCWAGPSATYYTMGPVNDDWVRTCGGDGFLSLPDTTDNRTVYSASQYLGLQRVDMRTREARPIRPDNARGAIQDRKNWDTWGRGVPDPPLGNAMAPANWDAPFIISPHDHRTLYAGTSQLWKTTDRGETWRSLGDLTTKVDRTKLKIMGQLPTDTVLSLDDGVPYYPTLTEISESPIRRGLLYVGTDDGNVQVSRDDGATWTNVTPNLRGVPPNTWVSGVEASRFDEGTVYVALDGHRSNDFTTYIFKSADYGRTFTSIVGDLPPGRVVNAIREDLKNAKLLYAATEFGLFATFDSGAHWVSLRGNMPTVAVNDVAIHPRDADLVVATHGRGVWILDNIAAMQELTPEVLAADVHLFRVEPAQMIRYSNPKAHVGDMYFRGQNPPQGAIVDYYLKDAPGADVTLTVMDAAGNKVATLPGTPQRGVNRVVWNLRYPSLPAPRGGGLGDDAEGPRGALQGPLVVPGEYTVRLAAAGKTVEQRVTVREDPRIDIPAAERKEWTDTLLAIADLYRAAAARVDTVPQAERTSARELQTRLATLYSAVSGSTGPLTADQRSQLQYFSTLLGASRR